MKILTNFATVLDLHDERNSFHIEVISKQELFGYYLLLLFRNIINKRTV